MSNFNLGNFKSFIAYDYESEGLNLNSSRPWEIAWVHFNHREIISKQQYYIYWKDLDISLEAKKITGFDQSDYNKHAVSPQQVWSEFSPIYLDKSVGIVGQNILGFDWFLTCQLSNFLKIYYPWKEVLERYIDTHTISKATKLDMKVDRDNFLAWQYKVNSIRAKVKTNLKLMCLENGIEWDDDKAHSALFDVEKTVEYFNKVIKYKLN